MIKTLIPVDTDLGSSIAIRYVEDLINYFQMKLYDIHIVEPAKIGSAPGSGWVQKTWENAILTSANEKIKKFLEMEKISQPLLKNPRIIIGDRNSSLLEELQQGQYNLFIEGCLPNFDPKIFYELLNSRLYRLMPCPVLLVKNLVPFDKIALVVEKDADVPTRFEWFFNFMKSSGVVLDVIRVKPEKTKTFHVSEGSLQADNLEALEKVVGKNGVTVGACKEIEGPPKKMAEMFREYGLVLSALRHKPRKNHRLTELLGFIASPILIGWY